jgi:ribokinase
MSQYDVCVLGSFMKDLVASAERRPMPGETLHGTGFAEFLGGKGVNQAIAAARMGARTAIVGTIGEDRYGEEFLELLESDGVDTAWVVRHPELGTGVGLPLVLPDGGNSIIIVSRANAAITPASTVLSVQLELPVEASRAALQLASTAGVTTILTPAPVGPIDHTLSDFVDILVPNEVEAAALTGLDCDDESQVPVIARKLADEWGLRGCVVTLGSRGAFVVDHDTGAEVWIGAHQVATVDTVGAGDAFCGSLAASLASGAQLVDAVRLANAAGALSTTVNGAADSAPDRATAVALLDGAAFSLGPPSS